MAGLPIINNYSILNTKDYLENIPCNVDTHNRDKYNINDIDVSTITRPVLKRQSAMGYDNHTELYETIEMLTSECEKKDNKIRLLEAEIKDLQNLKNNSIKQQD